MLPVILTLLCVSLLCILFLYSWGFFGILSLLTNFRETERQTLDERRTFPESCYRDERRVFVILLSHTLSLSLSFPLISRIFMLRLFGEERIQSGRGANWRLIRMRWDRIGWIWNGTERVGSLFPCHVSLVLMLLSCPVLDVRRTIEEMNNRNNQNTWNMKSSEWQRARSINEMLLRLDIFYDEHACCLVAWHSFSTSRLDDQRPRCWELAKGIDWSSKATHDEGRMWEILTRYNGSNTTVRYIYVRSTDCNNAMVEYKDERWVEKLAN